MVCSYWIRLGLCLFFAAWANACGNDSSGSEDSGEGGKKGRELSQVSPAFYDGKPSVSADGTKIILTSGKGRTAENGFFRAYLFEAAIGADLPETGTAVRKDADGGETGSETVSEVGSVISPDGNRIAVLTASVSAEDQTVDVLVYDATALPGTGTRISPTSTAIRFATQPFFSPDSKLLVWRSSEIDDETGLETVGFKGADLSGEIAEGMALQDVNIPTDATILGWLSAGSGYELAYMIPVSGSGWKMAKLSFVSLAEATSASPSDIATSATLDPNTAPAVLGSKIATASRSTATDDLVPGAKGEGVEEAPKTKLFSSLNLIDGGSGASATLSEQMGHGLVSLAAGDTLGVAVADQLVQCKAEEAAAYRSMIYWFSSDLASTGWVIPVHETAAAGSALVGVETDACGEKSAVNGVSDQLVRTAIVNGAATATQFRIVWETLRSGDREVRVLDLSGGEYKAQDLSRNRSS